MKGKILFLADVKDSTRLESAEVVFQRLDGAVSDLNSRLAPLIPLQRQYGDELAGVYETAESIYDIASALREAVYPETQIRFVAVRGDLGVVDSDMSKVGGLVFKHASQLIDVAKTKGRFGYFKINHQFDVALSSLVQMIDHTVTSMTAKQRRVYKLAATGWTHEEIGQQFGVSRQAVSDAARRGGVEFVLEAEDALRKLLVNC